MVTIHRWNIMVIILVIFIYYIIFNTGPWGANYANKKPFLGWMEEAADLEYTVISNGRENIWLSKKIEGVFNFLCKLYGYNYIYIKLEG